MPGLHNGIDTVAVISFGVFSLTYGLADKDNRADLHTSFGLLENAPNLRELPRPSWTLYIKRRIQRRRR